MARLGEAVGQVYVASQFPASSKAFTLQMVHDIEDAMDKEIGTLTWMSAETKAKAEAKLHMVADKIGYPDHWRDYSSLQVVRGDAIGQRMASGRIRESAATGEDRQAGRPRRVGYDSANGERLLRSLDERHQLSRPESCSRRSTIPKRPMRRTTGISARSWATS